MKQHEKGQLHRRQTARKTENDDDQYDYDNESSLVFSHRRRAETTIVDAKSDTCELTTQLTTTMMLPEVTFSGALFTVQSYDSFLKIVTLEFSVTSADTSNVNVQVYTKTGGFYGYHDNPSAWTVVSNATVKPSQYGLGTRIPISQFQPTTMEPHEVRAFYIAVTTPVLQFTKAPSNIAMGDTYQSDKFLSVSVGAGQLRYFGSNLIENRIYNGRVHYTTKQKCDNAKVSTTVVYSFLVDQSSGGGGAVDTSKVQSAMESSLNGVFANNPSFQTYTQQDRLTLDTVEAFPSNHDGECPDGWSGCSFIKTVVTLKHLDILDSGMLISNMLQNNVTLTTTVQDALGVKTQYAGNITISHDFIFTLKGVPDQSTLDDVQLAYFEKATVQFLQKAAQGLTSSVVLKVAVTDQSHSTRRRQLRASSGNNRRMQTSSPSDGPTSVMQLSGQVMGMYVPPQTLPYFGEFIEGLFSDNQQQYVQFLSYQAGGPGAIAESGRGTLFAQLFGITATLTEGTSLSDGGGFTPASSGSGGGAPSSGNNNNNIRLGFLGFCVLIICLMLLWLIYHFCGGKPPQLRRKRQRTTDDDPTRYQRTRSLIASKRNSFREFVRAKSSRRQTESKREYRGSNRLQEDECPSSEAKKSDAYKSESIERQTIPAVSKVESIAADKVKPTSDPQSKRQLGDDRLKSSQSERKSENSGPPRSRSNSRDSILISDVSSKALERLHSVSNTAKTNVAKPDAKDSALYCSSEPMECSSKAKSAMNGNDMSNNQSQPIKSTRQLEVVEDVQSSKPERCPTNGVRPRSYSNGTDKSRDGCTASRRNSFDGFNLKAADAKRMPHRTQDNEDLTKTEVKKDDDNAKATSCQGRAQRCSTRTSRAGGKEDMMSKTERRPSNGVRPRSNSEGTEMSRCEGALGRQPSNFNGSTTEASGKPPRANERQHDTATVEQIANNEKTMSCKSSLQLNPQGTTTEKRDNLAVGESEKPPLRLRSFSEGAQAGLRPRSNSHDSSRNSFQGHSERKKRYEAGEPLAGDSPARRVSNPESFRSTSNGSDREQSESVRRRSMGDASRERSAMLPPRSRSRERTGDVRPRSRSCDITRKIISGDSERSNTRKNDHNSSESFRRKSLSNRPSVPPRRHSNASSSNARQNGIVCESMDVSSLKAEGSKRGSNRHLKSDKSGRSGWRENAKDITPGTVSSIPSSRRNLDSSPVARTQCRKSCDKIENKASSVLENDDPNMIASGRNPAVSPNISSKPSDHTNPVRPGESKDTKEVDLKARLRQNKRARLKRAGMINAI